MSTASTRPAGSSPSSLPMRRFTHEGFSIALHDHGAGRPVVFLHNGGTSSTVWRHQVDDLAVDHRVVAVDLPGFGESPRPAVPATLDQLVRIVAGLIEELELGPTVVVGNCMGSNIASGLARTRPDLVAGVIAINPLTARSFSAGGIGFLHTMARRAPGPTKAFRSVARRLRVPGFVAAPVLRFQLGHEGVRRGLHRDPALVACQTRPDQLPALLDVLDDMEAYGSLDTTVLPAGIPVWIAWGEQNRILGRRQAGHLEQSLAAERVQVLPGTGHLAMLEDPATVTALIRDFFNSHEVPA